MSEQASTSKGIATRYATAVFGLADEQDDIQTLEQNVGILREALDKSMDLTSLISSPIYSRDQQQAAITAIAKKLGLSPVLTSTLSLMATKRRLFVVPTFLIVLGDLIAASNFSKDIKINSTVDPGLIGGMIVKVGSRMIDTTIKAKLNSLQNVMKEVG